MMLQNHLIAVSFMLVPFVVLLLIYTKGGLNWYSGTAMILANLPDLWGQLLPLIRGKRKEATYDHQHDIVQNPNLKIIIHQLFTCIGIVLVLFI